jgi:prepilin-type N-terminal cleavage/methylation domain-containing protein
MVVLHMKKGFGNKTRNKGFTLVEVLISLAILFIIGSALLALFANSYRDIEIAGKKNQELYRIQGKLEQNNFSDITSREKDLIITFPGVGVPVKVLGRIQTENMKVQEKELSVSVFIPD